MTQEFNLSRNSIIIDAIIRGPNLNQKVNLILDTGASITLIHPLALISAGYDINSTNEQAFINTASDTVSVPLLDLMQLDALGQFKSNFEVAAHPLPNNIGVDGLLGLDFFQNLELCIDFRNSLITLD